MFTILNIIQYKFHAFPSSLGADCVAQLIERRASVCYQQLGNVVLLFKKFRLH